MTWFERRARKTPGAKIQMIRKVVECVCVHACAPVWLMQKDFAYYFPFPLRPVPFIWTRAVFTQQHMHISVYSVFAYKRQKAKRAGMGGCSVLFFFKEENCKGENFISCSQQCRDVLFSFTLNFCCV